VVTLGVAALEDGGRVDFARLRNERRERVLRAMEEKGVDVLIAGRAANIRYVAGARRLHLSGTRPFLPGAVLVRETGDLHVVSTWDDGIPAEIPLDHLVMQSPNPLNIVAGLEKIGGLKTARVVAVDAISPLYRQLLGSLAPSARLVDGAALLRTVRSRKTADEIQCIRTAVAIAESSMAAAIDDLRPGVTERALVGSFEARMAQLGITTPASEGSFCVIPRGAAPPRRLASGRAIDAGDLVLLSAGVLYAGYEGTVGRTWLCQTRPGAAIPADLADLHARWTAARDAVVDACRPGATGADLAAAYRAGHGAPPAGPIAYSVGLGYERPIAGSALGPEYDSSCTIEADMVLCVEAHVRNEIATHVASEMVLVTAGEPELLTTMSHGPLAEQVTRGS
jgi:Xaa-Pro dipeptidase